MRNTPPPSTKTRKWLLYAILTLFIAIFAARLFERPRHDIDAEPRPVVARGDLAADERNTIDIFKSASPSVVYITTTELRRGLFSLNVYEIPQGTGSGFVWDKEGRIVTNFHVIGEASRVEVTLADQSTWEGKLVGAAPDKDIAVLQITAPKDKLHPISIGDSRNLQVGQKVFAIGNPFGLDHTITAGIVSALGREIKAVTGRTIQDVIQTDAAINPGNSGGPLLDSAGRLIGVNTAIFSPSGANSGIGFAVPVEGVNRVATELIRHGRLIRPGMGIQVANQRIVRRLKIKGVLIVRVQKNGAADRAGLIGTREVRGNIVLGDIIQSINGQRVLNYDDLRNELDQYKINDTVTAGILRGSKRMSVEVTLEAIE
ncbi:MAG: trypsin-like peptidase domain-containing protein [Desulfobacterales bacterium]|nr:trypsin-like peptidase domain-containing protein [Desulfobacterales bacterium]